MPVNCQLFGDGQLLISAGSDTTKVIETLTMYYLVTNRDWYQRVRDEVEEAFKDRPLSCDGLEKLPVLNAVINETLRMWPVTGNGLGRVSPPSGAMAGQKFVPGQTQTETPHFVTHIDARHFSPSPTVWRPERWLHPEKEEIFNMQAFMPFSVGPFNCIGKALAYSIMRITIATLVCGFDFDFPTKADQDAWMGKMTDSGVPHPAPLWLKPKFRRAVHHVL